MLNLRLFVFQPACSALFINEIACRWSSCIFYNIYDNSNLNFLQIHRNFHYGHYDYNFYYNAVDTRNNVAMSVILKLGSLLYVSMIITVRTRNAHDRRTICLLTNDYSIFVSLLFQVSTNRCSSSVIRVSIGEWPLTLFIQFSSIFYLKLCLKVRARMTQPWKSSILSFWSLGYLSFGKMWSLMVRRERLQCAHSEC